MGWEMGGEGAGVKSWGGYDIGGEGIISKKAAYVPGGKEICGCDFITLDNPEHCFLLGHLGVCTHGGSKGGGCSDVWVSSSKQLAGACQPWPTMPSSKTGSEYWIDGSHRETALEDFYVVGPELGRYWLPGGGQQGLAGAGAHLARACVLSGAGTGLVGRGRAGWGGGGMDGSGGWRETPSSRVSWCSGSVMMLQQLFWECSLRFCRMGPGFPVDVELHVSRPWGGERARGETRLPPEQPKASGTWVMSLARRGAAAGPSRRSPPQRQAA